MARLSQKKNQEIKRDPKKRVEDEETEINRK